MGHHNLNGGFMKKAFTLAEILITLGIIGIVAALTMPSLIQKYQDQVTVNKVKKIYSVLNNAYNLYKIDNSHELIPWTPEGAEKTFSIFKPYLKIAKDCGLESGKGCIYADGGYKYLSNNGGSNPYSPSKNYYKVRLADGSSLVFRGGGDVYGDITVDLEVFYDVNGEKGPNTWGIDMFEFDVYNNQLKPTGTLLQEPANSCAVPEAKGWGCTAWVLYNENLDYLHCDGLSWNGKRKCK